MSTIKEVTNVLKIIDFKGDDKPLETEYDFIEVVCMTAFDRMLREMRASSQAKEDLSKISTEGVIEVVGDLFKAHMLACLKSIHDLAEEADDVTI